MPDRFEQKLDALTKIVTDGFAAIADDFAELRHEISVRPTRQQVETIIGECLSPIAAELQSIRRDLSELRDRADNNAGLTKEVDHVLGRVAAIEAHLGIKHEIAA